MKRLIITFLEIALASLLDQLVTHLHNKPLSMTQTILTAADAHKPKVNHISTRKIRHGSYVVVVVLRVVVVMIFI